MIVVIIVGTLVYRYFQKGQEGEIPSITSPIEREAGFVAPEDLPASYTVKAGDHLWKIAEMYFQSGYNWIDIAQENNLGNPDALLIGQKITIPDVAPRQLTVEKLLPLGQEPISPGKYTVQEGDWLSKIALRAYGDIYAWEKIYEANKDLIGPSPHLIEIGQVLTIPE